MNHLREAIEAIDSKRATVQDTIPADKVREMAGIFLRISKDAICFDAGDGVEIGNLSGIAGLVRLPFNVCWIEFYIFNSENRKVHFGAMCETLGSDINILPLARNATDNTWHIMDVMVIRSDEKAQTVSYLTTPEMQDWYKSIGAIIVRFLSALNCKNVRMLEEKPSAALNKARLRRGKQPLFSTWTLSINIPKEHRESVAMGGSHASPRVHLRRGHPREYKPGLWTWVQPCAVGAKENGMIHKDYAAKIEKGKS